jgi:hypothetical protein
VRPHVVAFRELGSHPFISYDDTVYVTENPHVKAGLTADSVAWAFQATAGAHWHPVTWLSHMLDVTTVRASTPGSIISSASRST